MKLTEKDTKRFWSKVDKTGDCWEWTAAKSREYGQLGISGKLHYAHRISWTLTNGPIPPGLFVLHECDNPGCVNSKHLFLGTQLDNIRDRNKKGRAAGPKGEDHGYSKLTEKQVLEIRAKYIPFKYSQRKLAKEYGVVNSTIYFIITRKHWTHI